jgi:hypothetical protein
MLLALLVYSYATGMFSSRQIERASYENVAVRLLCADTHPDHDTLCTFRRKNGPLLTQAFKQILELSARCGVLQVGQITVAIDGTKILANASKHSAVSHGHAEKTLRALDLEIAELLAKADQADATPLQDGLTIPRSRPKRENAAYGARKPNSPAAPRPPPVGNHPAAAPRKPPIRRRNPRTKSTSHDPESRIMKTKDGFQQAYNAQAGVETASRLIVGPRVSQAANDKRELLPDAAAVLGHITPDTLLVDSGFVSAAAVTAVELATPGLTILAAAAARTPRGPHRGAVGKTDRPAGPAAGRALCRTPAPPHGDRHRPRAL